MQASIARVDGAVSGHSVSLFVHTRPYRSVYTARARYTDYCFRKHFPAPFRPSATNGTEWNGTGCSQRSDRRGGAAHVTGQFQYDPITSVEQRVAAAAAMMMMMMWTQGNGCTASRDISERSLVEMRSISTHENAIRHSKYRTVVLSVGKKTSKFRILVFLNRFFTYCLTNSIKNDIQIWIGICRVHVAVSLLVFTFRCVGHNFVSGICKLKHEKNLKPKNLIHLKKLRNLKTYFLFVLKI